MQVIKGCRECQALIPLTAVHCDTHHLMPDLLAIKEKASLITRCLLGEIRPEKSENVCRQLNDRGLTASRSREYEEVSCILPNPKNEHFLKNFRICVNLTLINLWVIIPRIETNILYS